MKRVVSVFSFGFMVLMVIFLISAFESCTSSTNSWNPGSSTGTVQGTIKDIATGGAVAAAVVSDGTNTATTNNNGFFTLTTSTGKRTLTVIAPGYATPTRVCDVASSAATIVDWNLTADHGAYWDYGTALPTDTLIPAANMDYIILAWNDLGMHCAQDDYSYFLILPPFNTLHVQVAQRGGGIVTSGITVRYAFPKKTNAALHTNFWTYASKYGWNVAANVGITGTPLAGDMTLDANGLGFVATGIPITPYDDDGIWDPYGQAVITLVDSATGTVLQTATVVAPVSTEMNCSNCHGITNPYLNILQAHDRLNGTTLVDDQAAGVLHLCAECHADNALGLAGKPGVKNLSLAMHGWHKDKMNVSADPNTPTCYNCHPGPSTKCLRGQMAHAGQSCQDCHGDMSGMTARLQAGRQPWFEEPRCADCHGAQYAENPNTLYRNSVFMNSPDTENNPSLMDGKIYCEACHNSTHAEFRSTNPADGSIPQQLQGDDYWIWNCYVCHTDYMPAPSMHRPI
jgi:hypothetical protein